MKSGKTFAALNKPIRFSSDTCAYEAAKKHWRTKPWWYCPCCFHSEEKKCWLDAPTATNRQQRFKRAVQSFVVYVNELQYKARYHHATENSSHKIFDSFSALTGCFDAANGWRSFFKGVSQWADTEKVRDGVVEPHTGEWEEKYGARAYGRWSAWQLPDLCGSMSMITWHKEQKLYGNKLPLLHLLSKLPPCRCLFRGFAESKLRCAKRKENREFVRRAVMTALVGSYCVDGVQPLPPTFATMQMTDSLGCQSLEDFELWCDSVPHIIFYSLKLVAVLYLQANYPLRQEVMTLYKEYRQYELDVVRISDMVRLAIPQQHSALVALDKALPREVGGAPYVHKIVKHDFANIVLNVAGPNLLIPPNELRQWIAPISKVCSHLELHNMRSEHFWLCGMNRATSRAVRDQMVKYNSGRNSGSTVKSFCRTLPNQQLGLLTAVLKSTDSANRLASHNLPHDVATHQLTALRARLGIQPGGKSLPARAGVVLYCVHCDDLKCFIAQDNPLNVFAVGAPRVFTNQTDFNKIHCNTKVEGQNGLSNCGGQELLSLDMKGIALRWRGRWLALCPYCASVCTFDMSRCDNAGMFSCGFCNDTTPTFADAKKLCVFCDQNTGPRMQRIEVFSDNSREQYCTVMLCPRHRVSNLRAKSAMTKDRLLEIVTRQNISRACK